MIHVKTIRFAIQTQPATALLDHTFANVILVTQEMDLFVPVGSTKKHFFTSGYSVIPIALQFTIIKHYFLLNIF